MENNTVTQESPARRAAIAGLAVVGFFALVFIGMVLAIYAARFVPKTASGLSSAAAYLSQVFTPAGTPATLSAVSTSTLPFPATDATSTATTTSLVATTTPTPTKTPVAPVAGPQTTTATPIAGSGSGTAVGTVYSGTPYGLPNLVVTITGVGYMNSNGNFVPATTILNSQALAVQFTVTNAGTNVTGPWNFSATLPTKQNSNYAYNSNQQQSLNPGDHINYTLHLDAGEALISNSDTISVTVDPNHLIAESSEVNTANATIAVSNQN